MRRTVGFEPVSCGIRTLRTRRKDCAQMSLYLLVLYQLASVASVASVWLAVCSCQPASPGRLQLPASKPAAAEFT